MNMNESSWQLAQCPERCAFFFDVDGTLADIQPRPDDVFIPPPILISLADLHRQGVPVAVISGRPLAQLDGLLFPLRLPAAGIHGAERRSADGAMAQAALDLELMAEIEQELAIACAEHPGLRLESKGIAFALHYRGAPELGPQAEALAGDFVARYGHALTLQPGKCVYELKPRGASKGEVIRAFMDEAPFAGRLPVFVGDDLTDEAGFEAVNELGGISIKVGEGPTCAQLRLHDVAAVAAWLQRLVTGLPTAPLFQPEQKREPQ